MARHLKEENHPLYCWWNSVLSDSPERIFIMTFKYIILKDDCYSVL